MSLTTLRDYYYYSAQLKTIAHWCDGGYEANWKEIEGECEDIPIQAMIGDYKLAVNYLNHFNPFTLFTLHTWYDVIKQLHLRAQIKKRKWIAHDIEFKPIQMDSGKSTF